MRRSLELFLALTLVGFSALSLVVRYSQFPYDKVEVYKGVVTLEEGKTTHLPLPRLRENDRVLINLQTIATVKMKAYQDGKPASVMPLVVEGARYSLVDYLLTNQKGFFVAKEGNVNCLALYAPFPSTPYHVIFPLEGSPTDEAEEYGKMEISRIETHDGKMLNVTLIGEDEARLGSAMLAHPVDMIVQEDFKAKVRVSLRSSNGSVTVYFNVMSNTDDILYSYEILSQSTSGSVQKDFELNVTSEELQRRGNILGDKISCVSVSIVIESHVDRASILLGDVEIQNAGKGIVINANAVYSYQVPYEIYVAHKYSPSVTAFTLWLLLSVGVVVAWRLISDGAPSRRLSFLLPVPTDFAALTWTRFLA